MKAQRTLEHAGIRFIDSDEVEGSIGLRLTKPDYAEAHKDCTPALLPTIRVIEAPKSGTLTVRVGELKTNQVASCPGLKTPACVVFYPGSCWHDRYRSPRLCGDKREWSGGHLRCDHQYQGSTQGCQTVRRIEDLRCRASAELRRERLERDLGIFGDDSQQRAGGWIR